MIMKQREVHLLATDWLGTIYSFPDLKKDQKRTRIIIFATDNDVAGTETLSLEESCSLCKQYKINVYAYCPTKEMNKYVTETSINDYKNAIEKKANGKFYTGEISKIAPNIMDEIKKTKISLMKTSEKKYIVDHPEFAFIIMTICILILIILEKWIKI